MSFFRKISEGLAGKTTRRGLFGRGSDVAIGTLIGVAAGSAIRSSPVSAGAGTVCAFPGPPCCRENCLENGTCAKPCLINTTWYAGGCWVVPQGGNSVTCCDCTCQDISGSGFCGCGTDYHNDPDQFASYPVHCADWRLPTSTPTATAMPSPAP